jgi:GTP-binding protein YchF
MKGDKTLEHELAFLERIMATLNGGKSARTMDLLPDELALMADIPLLSNKPVIYAANISEDDITGSLGSNKAYHALKRLAEDEHSEIIPICANIEAEIAELDEGERTAFLADLGIDESSLAKLIKSSYKLLGLISFLTAGPKEVRAWTIAKGTKAPQAAGKIHTDFERGFIRAEVIAYDDLLAIGTMAAAKEKGLIRSEGKDYVFRDGDVTLFRFNV